MKRVIKFRGKTTGTNKWVYGDLVHNAFDGVNRNLIIGIKPDGCYPIEVIPESVCQFTNTLDKNKKEIYDKDILYSESWGVNARSKNKYHVVQWGRVGWVVAGYNGQMKVTPSLDVKQDFVVVGNSIDNQELLQ